MHIKSLLIMLCAIVAGVSARNYTVIKSAQYGLNLTFDNSANTVSFEPGSINRYWTPKPITHGVKNWFLFNGYHQHHRTNLINFHINDYKPGAIATITYDNFPALFEVEQAGNVSYVIALESADPKQRLAWTAERNSTVNGTLALKLQPYDRRKSQMFIFSEEYVSEP